MQKNQNGFGSIDVFLIIALACVALIWGYYYTPASIDQIQEVNKIAAPSEKAQKVVKEFLATNKEPNKSELFKLHREINKIVVAEYSVQVGGATRVEPQPQQEIPGWFYATLNIGAIFIAVCIAIWLVIRMFANKERY